MTKIQKFKTIILFSIFYFLFSNSPVLAVTLYLEPSSGGYHSGDTFLVDINIDTQGKCINATEIHLSFPQDILEGVDFSKGDSILTFWVKTPVINQELGLVSFIAGIPGGYCGILPGDPREHSHLGRIIFRVHETDAKLEHETDAKLKFLDNSQVLLNDGFGTRAELVIRGAVFTILPERRDIPKDEWKEKIEKDIIPPEPFEIEIHQDPFIFEGKYFISFFTTDKQTGIDYFEVQEGQRSWRRAKSPYLLQDQTLQSIIRVKAVDMAGNERIVEHLPLRKPFPYWVILVVLLVVGIILWLWRKYTKKHK